MERELVEILSRIFSSDVAARVASLGIGDDAAVLRGARGQLVWSIDASVEGVHFDRRWLSLEDVGARSFEAAASDLAAMGARPIAALSSVIAPRASADSVVPRIARGQADAAARLRCPVVGGNLARGAELSVTTSVVGVAARPLTRAGARPGDEVWLVGEVGLAAAGLRALQQPTLLRRASGGTKRMLARCVAAWRRPQARISAGRALGRVARAAIDVSDGLAEDAGHVAEASRVRIVLEDSALLRALPADLLIVAPILGVAPLSLALAGGEDYALLATGPAAKRPRGAKRIGRVEKGRAGVVVEDADGTRRDPPRGFDHFR